MLHRILYGFIAIVFLLGLYYRLDTLVSHSSEIDESLPATKVITARHVTTEAHMYKVLHDSTVANYNGKFKRTLRKLDSMHLLKPLYPAVDLGRKLFIVPLTTTYAPLQHIISSSFFSFDKNWQINNYFFWGRLPSLLCDCVTYCLICFLGFVLFRDKKSYSLFFCAIWTVIWAHSLELRNFAVSAMPYSIGLAGASFLLIWMSKERNIAITVAVFCLVLNMQYTTLPFILACWIFMFYNEWKVYPNQSFKETTKRLFSKYGIATLVFFVVFFVEYILLISRNLYLLDDIWYIGSQKEFLFPPSLQKGIIEALRFFPQNMLTIVSMLFTDHVIEDRFSVIFLLLNVIIYIGIVNSLRQIILEHKGKASFIHPKLLLLILLMFGCYISLVVVGKYPLAPSRHSLLLLPILSVFFIIGLISLYRMLSILIKFDVRIGVYMALAVLGGYVYFHATTIYAQQKKIFEEPLFSSKGISAMQHFSPHLLISGDDKMLLMRNDFQNSAILYLRGTTHRLPSVYWIRSLSVYPKELRIIFYNVASYDTSRVHKILSDFGYHISKLKRTTSVRAGDEVFLPWMQNRKWNCVPMTIEYYHAERFR